MKSTGDKWGRKKGAFAGEVGPILNGS